MALILNLETSTSVCSVALAQDGELLSLSETDEDKIHSSVITLFIQKVLKKAKKKITDIDAISVSKGPGSYTGLRVGVSVAKGLCYSLDKPLIAIDTLQAMAWGVTARQPPLFPSKGGFYIYPSLWEEKGGGFFGKGLGDGLLLCPIIDARRMEVFTALYDSNNNQIKEATAIIIDDINQSEIVKIFLKKYKIIFFGNGVEKSKPLLKHSPNAYFIHNFLPSAKDMIVLSERKCKKNDFENPAYFEPFYLKNFIPTKKI